MQALSTEHHYRKQSGIATLISAIVLLLLITMIVVLSANITLMETKASSNEYKLTQSFLAAQSGLAVSLATLNKNNIKNIPQTELSYSENLETINIGSYSVSIESLNSEHLKIQSTGYSSDKSSQSTHYQHFLFSRALRPDFRNFIVSPIIATGEITITPNKISIEKTDKVLVWSGDLIHSRGIVSADDFKKIYANDIRTQNPHQNIFALRENNKDNKNLKKISWLHNCEPTCTELNHSTSRIIYFNGGLKLSNKTIGSAESPVILYIDLQKKGALNIDNVTINGLIFVNGEWDNKNLSSTINGAIIVDGNLKNAQNLVVTFNKTILSQTDKIGIYTPAPGSWNDIQTTL